MEGTLEKLSRDFVVGDVVELKSGGLKMTVSAVHDDEVEVTWTTKTGIKQSTLKKQILTYSQLMHIINLGFAPIGENWADPQVDKR